MGGTVSTMSQLPPGPIYLNVGVMPAGLRRRRQGKSVFSGRADFVALVTPGSGGTFLRNSALFRIRRNTTV